MKKIRAGIVGYGNLGRGVEKALNVADDFELCAVFTRRAPENLKIATAGVKIDSIANIASYVGKIDVMLLCGGSATDLPEQGPMIAKLFNTIDSFDTHAKIPEYIAKMDKIAKDAGNTSIVSVGWDPGLFSIARVLFGALLPVGEDYTFWGKGVSQGHSDAIRRVEGVAGGVQYTVPREKALEQVMSGNNPKLTTRDKHLRECFVVAKEGADKAKIEKTIKEMPNYFADYDTVVNFITADELKANHSKLPHGGTVIRGGATGENKHVLQLKINLESNPEFTASIAVAYARAAFRMSGESKSGAYSVLDIPLSYLSPKSYDELIRMI